MRGVERAELLHLVTRVRRRWRARVALQGAAALLGVALVWLILGTWVLEQVRFAGGGVLALRIVGWAAGIAVLVRYIVLPLARRVPDHRVALYIEEHDPGLQAALLAAVEQTEATASAASPALVERVVQTAVERVRAADAGRAIEARRLRRAGAWAAGIAAAGLLIGGFGPPTFRHAVRALLVPWDEAAAATPYAVMVWPGNATVPKGADIEIGARLRGFSAEVVELLIRSGDSPEWQRVPMIAGDSSGVFAARLFDIMEPTHYVVEANGVRSPPFTVTVTELPAVDRLAIELTFPPHTGLPPERQEPGGDLVVPRGTTVRFVVTPTMPAAAGLVRFTPGDSLPLEAGAEGLLTGSTRVVQPGSYRIALQAGGGQWVEASLTYRIDVLEDRGPTVLFRTPGRDLSATAVEEVFTEVEGRDDFGIRTLELLYRVNGGEEQKVTLHQGTGRRLATVTAGYTFFLEEQNLVPGDLVSYYARVTDNSPAARSAQTDIYFIRIRAFGRDYRQAENRGMPGQRQSQGDTPEGLSQRQREIVAGTYKVLRDRETASEQVFREDLATLALAQGRLRERVAGLVQEMIRRNAAGRDSTFAVVQRELTDALPQMEQAESHLGRREPDRALGPEQRALQHLQRAEEAFREIQVSLGGQPGAAGGQGASANAEDLADLFELETDKLRNQYETVERGDQERQQQEIDETLERLRQLASRQQQESERLRRAAEQLQQRAGQQAGGSGAAQSDGGAAQRRLAQEAEEMARRLERLARERQSPELTEAARRLQEAADAMRRSAAGQSGNEAQSAAAAERLRQATRALERGRNASLERRVADARERAEDLVRREREISRDLERALAGGRPTAEQQRVLEERKDSLAAAVDRLEEELDRLARETRGTRPETGRRLEEAAAGIRQDRIQDRIRFSRGLLRGANPDYVRNFEQQISATLDSVAARVGRASQALAAADSAGPSRALDRARELVQGMESLRERLEEAGRVSESQNQRGEPQGPGSQPQPGAAARSPGRRMEDQPPVGGRPGWLDPQLARQFVRELRERRLAADSLRSELERLRLETEDLERIIAELREFESGRLLGDPLGVERLQREVVDRLKAFEFALRRQLEGDGSDRPVVGAAEQVPPRFRELVEEYYRALARTPRPNR
jgi:hypothetical protein